MHITKQESIEIFRMLSEKVGEPCDGYGFKKMASFIGEGVSERLLSDKYRETNSSEDKIPLSPNKMDLILQALGFRSISEFRLFLTEPISEALTGCFGIWISFVRQNSEEGILYQSPVQIYQKDQKAYFKLRGPNTTYEGEITYANGCLTTLFSGDSGKLFHHIYKIGNRKNPKVLQGIYSGISTADDPIGGRTVLYRTDQKFEGVENKILHLKDLKLIEDPFYRNMSSYFETFEKNNLRLNPIISFGPEDLKSN